MPTVTFQVLEGIDKGRVFRDLSTPVTIGREEGNILRLNDERVSRFHAKVQSDNGEIIITDLESTNGTRVNNNVVQIRRLQAGDRVGIGRSLLLFGTDQQIRARMETQGGSKAAVGGATYVQPGTLQSQGPAGGTFDDLDLKLGPAQEVTIDQGNLYLAGKPLPPLPMKLSPSQAARLAEMLDFLHRHLTGATENIRAADDGSQVALSYADWQRVLGVQMLLARYVRAVAEPDALDE
ncbi:MAG: FHA domain-containing protein [Gemmataceae bacterium]|nr:FHA domain-containing protein [Gemmataceae bacterium]